MLFSLHILTIILVICILIVIFSDEHDVNKFRVPILIVKSIEAVEYQVTTCFHGEKNSLTHEADVVEFCTQKKINRPSCSSLRRVIEESQLSSFVSDVMVGPTLEIEVDLTEIAAYILENNIQRVMFIHEYIQDKHSSARTTQLLRKVLNNYHNASDLVLVLRYGQSSEVVAEEMHAPNLFTLHVSDVIWSHQLSLRVIGGISFLTTQIRNCNGIDDISRTDKQSITSSTNSMISNRDIEVIYLHNMGPADCLRRGEAIQANSIEYNNWEDRLLHELLDRADSYSDLLQSDYFDVIGFNMQSRPVRHLKENVWWSRMSYLSHFHDLQIHQQSSSITPSAVLTPRCRLYLVGSWSDTMKCHAEDDLQSRDQMVVFQESNSIIDQDELDKIENICRSDVDYQSQILKQKGDHLHCSAFIL